MLIRVVIVAVLVGGLAFTAHATEPRLAVFQSGTSLKSACEADGTKLLCSAYLQGVADSYTTTQFKKRYEPILCMPVEVTAEQLIAVFMKYMQQNPEQWHFAASELALNAFAQAWPCE